MTLSRRLVLTGGGATVALPLFTSLLSSREARAQVAVAAPNFVSYVNNHGGAWAASMFPSAPAQGTEVQTFAGQAMRRFPLVAQFGNSMARVSPILSAASSKLTPLLLKKMFSIQGVDVPFYLAHNTGGALGNYAANDGNGGEGVVAQTQAKRRTVDQIMAWSPAFYPDLSGIRQRVLLTANRVSYNYANPQTRTGAIQEIDSIDTPNRLFDSLFPSGGGPTQRKPIVDLVLESYKNLRASARISAADKNRLDDHLQRLSEVQRRFGIQVSCGSVARPSNPSMSRSLGDVMYSAATALNPTAHTQYYQAINDVIVLALSCGVSRISVNHIKLTLSDYAGDWHQEVAHQAEQPDGVKHAILAASYQRLFENVIVDLAAKLDAVDLVGGTLLDRTLLAWTQECGNLTHSSTSVPVVGFGSAGGFLKTGFHHDYRDLSRPFQNSGERGYPGLLWNQWLGTVLQAMRIPRNEWENKAVCGGYPDYKFQGPGSVSAQAWTAAKWALTGEVLPWLK
jgi:Protein of unknown function (DUF1552)